MSQHEAVSHLILYVNEGTHVQLLWEGHAVVEFNTVHSGVIEVEAFELQSQQVWKMKESQALETKQYCISDKNVIRSFLITPLDLVLSPCGHRISSCISHRSTDWARPESQAG